jgi:hypothetical protein
VNVIIPTIINIIVDIAINSDKLFLTLENELLINNTFSNLIDIITVNKLRRE